MKLIIDNLATEYRDEGVGKIILFLHGWGDNLSTFNELADILKNNYRVIRVDLPGFGKTEKPEGDRNLYFYGEFVSKFIEKLEINPDAIIGHSFGGRIALKAISEELLFCSQLVLIASAGLEERRGFSRLLLKFLAKIIKWTLYIPPFVFWRAKLRRKIYELLGSDYENAGEMKGTFVKIISENLSYAAKKIKIPTLLIWGKEDKQTPLKQGEKFLRLLENSHLEVIESAGHFLHQQKPKEVAKLIDKFL